MCGRSSVLGFALSQLCDFDARPPAFPWTPPYGRYTHVSLLSQFDSVSGTCTQTDIILKICHSQVTCIKVSIRSASLQCSWWPITLHVALDFLPRTVHWGSFIPIPPLGFGGTCSTSASTIVRSLALHFLYHQGQGQGRLISYLKVVWQQDQEIMNVSLLWIRPEDSFPFE